MCFSSPKPPAPPKVKSAEEIRAEQKAAEKTARLEQNEQNRRRRGSGSFLNKSTGFVGVRKDDLNQGGL